MMKYTHRFTMVAAMALALTFTACTKDDDDEPENEQELITTVELTLTNDSTGVANTYFARDLDGDGGNPPVIDDITMEANTSHTATVRFLDERNPDDVEDITEEVEEEALEHLVCYAQNGNVIVGDLVQDTDSEGNPLGLTTTFTTGDAGTGGIRVSLKHEPDKSASDPCSTGETDVEVTFDVTVN